MWFAPTPRWWSADMSQNLATLEVRDGLGQLTLNHPEKRNALSRAMLTQLRSHLVDLGSRKEARVVILRAAGSVFSSGLYLRELMDCSTADATSLFALCTEVMLAVRQLPQPVIAQV